MKFGAESPSCHQKLTKTQFNDSRETGDGVPSGNDRSRTGLELLHEYVLNNVGFYFFMLIFFISGQHVSNYRRFGIILRLQSPFYGIISESPNVIVALKNTGPRGGNSDRSQSLGVRFTRMIPR